MKSLVVLALFFESVVLADVAIFTTPPEPAVYLSDLEQNPGMPEQLKAKGPWFEAQYTLRNDFSEPVELANLEVKAVSPEGKSVSKSIFLNGILQPGESKKLSPDYFGQLPAEASLAFTVTATAHFKRGGQSESRAVTFKTH